MKLAKRIFVLALMLGSAYAHAATMYQVDEDHDGRADRTLELEHSDSLA